MHINFVYKIFETFQNNDVQVLFRDNKKILCKRFFTCACVCDGGGGWWLKAGMPGSRLPAAGNHMAPERRGTDAVSEVRPDGCR